MEAYTLVMALSIGAAYALWPIIARTVGLSGEWVAIVIILGTALPMLSLSLLNFPKQTPEWWAIAILFGCALLNGLAQTAHSWKAGDTSIKIGFFSMIVYVAMIVLAPLFDRVLNAAPMSKSQLAAIPLALLVVYLSSS